MTWLFSEQLLDVVFSCKLTCIVLLWYLRQDKVASYSTKCIFVSAFISKNLFTWLLKRFKENKHLFSFSAWSLLICLEHRTAEFQISDLLDVNISCLNFSQRDLVCANMGQRLYKFPRLARPNSLLRWKCHRSENLYSNSSQQI